MLVREMLTGLTRNLAGMFPEHAAEYRSNARKLKDELEALDADLMQRFAKIPEEKRVFLTFHPSWRYYAYNYQLREISIEVDGKEPGPRSMKETVDTARRYGIRAVFVEPQFPKAAAKAIASSIGAKIYEADPLAENLPELYKSMADMLVESFPE